MSEVRAPKGYSLTTLYWFLLRHCIFSFQNYPFSFVPLSFVFLYPPVLCLFVPLFFSLRFPLFRCTFYFSASAHFFGYHITFFDTTLPVCLSRYLSRLLVFMSAWNLKHSTVNSKNLPRLLLMLLKYCFC